MKLSFMLTYRERESYGKDIAIAVKDRDKDEVETVLHCIKEELIRGRS
jgi:hypothetical protein